MLVRTSKDKDHPYVLINKSFLEDSNISLKAKGLLAYCMSKPDHWEFHISQLASVLKEGEAAIYSAFKELIRFGYCKFDRERDEKGVFSKGRYILFETPQKEIKQEKNPSTSTFHPHRDFPHVGFPDVENRALVNNEYSKKRDDDDDARTRAEKKPSSFHHQSKTFTIEDLYFYAVKSSKDWSNEEIQEAWQKYLSVPEGSVSCPMSYVNEIIRKMRILNSSKQTNKQESKQCPKNQTQKKKEPTEKSKSTIIESKHSECVTPTPQWLNSLSPRRSSTS